MRTAYLVLGPESSGTRMLTRAFVAAGCFGDGGHVQRLDCLDFRGYPDRIVFRQSLPHGDGWPDCPRIVGSMTSAGYAVQPVLILRDKDHTVRSQRARKHAFSRRQARRRITDALDFAYRQLAEVDHTPLVVLYEPFVRYEAVRRTFFEQLGLECPTMEFFDANARHRRTSLRWW
ncbi:hypothetical protein ACIRRA_30945 [Nocardia sp. NPDC101769]|uniref:hypothetical protein n=1 Tax=Nocardia sp. NPDC101769 TaxID=3364333 RepID=UPI00381A0CC5